MELRNSVGSEFWPQPLRTTVARHVFFFGRIVPPSFQFFRERQNISLLPAFTRIYLFFIVVDCILVFTCLLFHC